MANSEGLVKPKLKLYSYWLSSCAWRVRIALNLKGLDYEYITVNLLKGEHLTAEYQKLNPLSYVPVLVDEDIVIADSFAIIMYLEEKYPQHALLPQDLQKKALNYQIILYDPRGRGHLIPIHKHSKIALILAANVVASNIQPFQNLAVAKYIEEKLGSAEKLSWTQHHIKKGFSALEKLLAKHAGKYAIGDEVALADLFLEPQIGGAITRFNIDMAEFPTLKRVYDAYSELPAFQNAVPAKQPDAPDHARS